MFNFSIHLSTTTISDTIQSPLSVRKPIIPDRSLKAKVLLRSSDLYEDEKNAQPDEIEQVNCNNYSVHILTIFYYTVELSLNKVLTFISILGIRSRTRFD